MNDPAVYLSLFILGISAGMVYFGGLRLTVLFASAGRRSLMVAASFILRAAFAGAAFMTAAVAGWQQYVMAAAGFFLVRWAIREKFGQERSDEETS